MALPLWVLWAFRMFRSCFACCLRAFGACVGRTVKNYLLWKNIINYFWSFRSFRSFRPPFGELSAGFWSFRGFQNFLSLEAFASLSLGFRSFWSVRSFCSAFAAMTLSSAFVPVSFPFRLAFVGVRRRSSAFVVSGAFYFFDFCQFKLYIYQTSDFQDSYKDFKEDSQKDKKQGFGAEWFLVAFRSRSREQ